MIQPTILVIKHGGLGDFIQALDAFWWLRNHHQHARLVLLTSPSLQPFASTVPWFDACLYDRRSWSSLISIPALIRKLRPHRIYDLQTSNRTATYLRLLQSAGWRGEWSGHARGASHRHDDPNRDHIHTRERLQAQLRIAGVPMLGEAPLNWLGTPSDTTSMLEHKKPYAVLVTACSPDRPDKRWPASAFARLATLLHHQGLKIVLAGAGSADRSEAAIIMEQLSAGDGINLVDRTDLHELAVVFRKAALAIGADTGIMHLAAKLGTKTLTLFGQASDPRLCAPTGKQASYIRASELTNLRPEEVFRDGGLQFDAAHHDRDQHNLNQ